MKTFLTITCALALFCLAVAVPASAGTVPQLMNVQGKLTDPGGTPVTDGAYSVVFSIYNVASVGTALWQETQSVSVVSGLFSVNLGAVTPLPVTMFDSTTLWLGMKVGTDPEMTPRQRLTTSAYAFTTPAAAAAGGWVDGGTIVRLQTASDFVGIGTATPGYKLEVVTADATAARFSNTGTAARHTIKAINTSGTCAAFQAGSGTPGYPTVPVAVSAVGFSSYNGGFFKATGSGKGLLGQNTGSGDAIEGWAYGSSARYSGYFHGGQGVYIDGYLQTTDTIESTTGGFKFPDGTVQTTAAGPSPIAFGFINSNGTVSSAWPSGITCTWSSTLSRYEITIPGETYWYSSYVTVVTISGSTPLTTSNGSASGKLLVNVYNSSGTLVQNRFQFVTYKP